jgi:hypothetical protein
MSTVLEEYIREEQRSLVPFLWEEGLNTKDIHKAMFPVYDGKCLSHKAVQNRVADISLMTKRLKRRCESGRDKQTDFNTLVKRWDKCISVCGGYVEK